MNSIIPGPWVPALDHKTVPELKATVAEKEAEIARLLRCYRAAIFMKESLHAIACGKVLPAQNRRAAVAALNWVEREFPELEDLEKEGY